jgi:hypothetical protein
MTIGADFEVQADGDIRHVSGSTNYTVLELHRWLQDLADNASSTSDDFMDITRATPSDRSYDTIITLNSPYNIDDTTAQYFYGGSIIQGGGSTTIYDGIQVLAPAGMYLEIIQNNALITNFWTTAWNADATNGISHQFLVKVRSAGSDIDGRRLIGITRELGKTYGEFKINGTARGVNVMAFTGWTDDLNNQTAAGTISGWNTITNNSASSGATASGTNNVAATTLNVSNGGAFTKGDIITIGTYINEYQITNIVSNALTITPGLDYAASSSETIYKVPYGYVGLDVNADTTNEYYYSQWTKAGLSINQLYERLKWLTQRQATPPRLFGMSAILFRGVTHEIVTDTPSGTFFATENVSWGSGATAGTGRMLAINSTTNPTKMWIQLTSGVIPTDNATITGGGSGATCLMNVTITERTVATPFIGISTGTAIIGAYGVGVLPASLSVNDKVKDLTNAVINPPNNITFTVNNLVSGTDNVLVTMDNGSTDILVNQFTLNGLHNGASQTTVVVNEAIPADVPASAGTTGSIRVLHPDGSYSQHRYTSYNAGTKTFTIPSVNWSSNSPVGGANAFIGYIDKMAGSTSESFSCTYVSNRTLFVRVRDAAASPPIKTAGTTGTLGTAGGSVTVTRISDA